MKEGSQSRLRHSGVTAWLVAGCVLGAGGASVVLAAQNGAGLGDQVGFMLPFLTFPPIAAVVAAKRPSNPIGWLLLAASGCIVGYAFLQQYGEFALVTSPGTVPGAAVAAWVRTSLWVPSATIVLVFLPLLLPDGRAVSARWRLVGWVAAGTASAQVVLFQVAAWGVPSAALLDPEEAWVVGTWVEAVAGVGFPVLLVCGVAAWTSLVLRFRRSSGVERLQLKWITFAIGLFTLGLIVSMPLPEDSPSSILPSLLIPLIPLAIAAAVLRYRLFEIDRIISRTVSYVVLTGALVSVYAAGVLGVGALLPGERSDLLVAGSTLTVAALFQPMRTRIQALVDRRFNRARYDTARTVEDFSARLRDQIDVEALRMDLLSTARASMEPRTSAVWLPAP